MSVRAHSKKDEIEARNSACFELEKLSESLFVGGGNGVSVRILCREPEYVPGRDGNFRQHGFVRHPVIAVRVVRRDVSLISPEKEHTIPGKCGPGIGCQQV